MIRLLLVSCFLLISIWAAPAGAVERFELLDGTVLQGEIVSFDGSVFTVRTENLGTMKIESSKIRNIQSKGQSATGGSKEVQDLKSRLMANPETLSMIMELQNDPEVQEILQDAEILKAVEAGDVQKLMSNPKIMKLLQNPKVQEIGKGFSK